MTKLLLHLFVKDYENTGDPAVRSAIGALSGAVGICCNLLLTAVKLLTGWLTGSLAVTADGLNNLSDATGSIMTLAGFRLAGKPADAHHPYGHARMEYLSGLAVAVLVLFMGLELAKGSVQKILDPAPVAFSAPALTLLVLSIAVKLWMFLFNRSLGNKIQSAALLATAADSRNDCVATTAVLLSGLLGRAADWNVDGFMGLGVSVFILYSGWRMAKETVSPLLGESADPDLRQHLVDYIQAQPGVLGYHDLMVHDYGPGKRFASIHVEMDKNQDPLACHERIDDMERECLHSHNVQLVIHFDPVVTDDPEQNRIRQLISAILRVKDRDLTLHDFRKQGRLLSFDVSLPPHLVGRQEDVRQCLYTALADLGENWQLEITFDLQP